MKPDTQLLAAFGSYLRGLRPDLGKPLVVTPPVQGLDGAAEIDRVLQVAESKWLVDRLVRGGSPNAPTWTFELTTRGLEMFALD